MGTLAWKGLIDRRPQIDIGTWVLGGVPKERTEQPKEPGWLIVDDDGDC